MSESVSFPSVSNIHSLPLLFSGQAQKELSINQSLGLVDILLQRCIDGSSAAPPASPNEGSIYRVTSNPIEEWADQADNLAIWLGGAWHFVSAFRGLSMFDREVGKQIVFDTSWQHAPIVTVPDGGTTIDQEARVAIDGLIQALTSLSFLNGV